MKTLIFLVGLNFIFFYSTAQITQWRGDNFHSGVYNEDGLLEKWPDNGPELLWYNDSLPTGHSSVTFGNNIIYLTGKTDTMDVLIALDMQGKLKWQVPYGRAWMQSFPDSRCTPTMDGDNIYVSSGYGEIACIDASSGKIRWSVDAAKKFDAKFNEWGVTESVIIKDNMLFFSPIGSKTSMVALNKNTGETIWQSESLGDSLAYVSPILINYAGKDILVNLGACYLFGVDASDGKILWKYYYYGLETPTWHILAPIINCVSPVYFDGKIYQTSGYNHVGAMLKLNEDASAVELLWSDSTIDTHHGGVVKIGGYIYGSNWIDNSNGNWCCIEWETGKKMYETTWNTKGSIIANKEMLYCYDEKRGNLALVKANPEKFEPISTFKVPYGNGPYWSHPVINDGILYVRHGTALMAYSIKEKS